MEEPVHPVLRLPTYYLRWYMEEPYTRGASWVRPNQPACLTTQKRNLDGLQVPKFELGARFHYKHVHLL